MTTVLFACVQNAGRSQMAAAWFNRIADRSMARAISAGTRPARVVHPTVVEAMGEVGIDLSAVKPRQLTPALSADVRWLITLGCGEECPVIPGVERDDWPIRDPAGLSIAGVREIRDAIHERVEAFVGAHGWRGPAS